MEHIIDRESDIAFLTETWLHSDNNSITAEIKTYGYQLLHNRRKDRLKDRGGGVGILVKSTLTAKQLPAKHFSSFEHTIVKIPLVNKKIMFLISVYRLQFVATSTFIEEFTDLLDLFAVSNENLIIAGDINIHVETETIYAKNFKELIDLYGLRQHINVPTHVKGHTLDLVITPNKKSYLKDINITELDLSHHFLIDFTIIAEPNIRQVKTITYRCLKKVDIVTFNNDVKDNLSAVIPTDEMAIKTSSYNSVLTEIINRHAPVKTRKIKVVPEAPWFDAEYANLRKLRRRAEKKYRRTGLENDKITYITLRKQAITTSFDKKKSFVINKLEQGNSCKTLYAVVNNLIDSKKEVILPKSESNKELANSFLNYFQEKIEQIRVSFSTPSENVVVENLNPNVEMLLEFEPATADEIKQITMAYEVKCSPEDPVPSELLSSNIDTFIPFWLEIVNLSLKIGSMEGLKSAVVIPLIKELSSSVDTEKFKSYRPVSNLLFVSKIVERIVDKRLDKHMVRNSLLVDIQYGYKKDHSTENLLLKVVNDLFESFDKNIPSVVILLDLSAAFDTVDHAKLLTILQRDIGVAGVALKWFESFLTKRTQKVKIGTIYSDVRELAYGVAQGSVLGPRLFKIYIRSLYKYIEPTKFNIEGFADDHQLIKQFLISLQRKALGEDINNCLIYISKWMHEHFLCLNQSKTKILVIAPPSTQKEIVIRGVFLENECLRFVDSAKNLGIILDNVLSFKEQINKVVKTSFSIIKKLYQIKGFLSEKQLQQLVSSYIFSKLDYCNSLYYGMSSNLLKKLQQVQNSAARLVSKTRIPNGTLDTFILKFHWLKVRERIIYKVLLIVHNCLHQKAPNELSLMFQYAESIRTMHLRESKCSNRYGVRAFSHVGPKLWNLLPMQVRDIHDTPKFKKNLKTFLMCRGNEYCSWIFRR